MSELMTAKEARNIASEFRTNESVRKAIGTINSEIKEAVTKGRAGFVYNIVTLNYIKGFFGEMTKRGLLQRIEHCKPIGKRACDFFLQNYDCLLEEDLRYIIDKLNKRLGLLVALRRENELAEKLRKSKPLLFWVDEGEFIAQIQKETRSE